MAVAVNSIGMMVDPNHIELGDDVFAFRYLLRDGVTHQKITSGFWIWHLPPSTSSNPDITYCKIDVPERMVDEDGKLNLRAPIACSICGRRGTITDGQWTDAAEPGTRLRSVR